MKRVFIAAENPRSVPQQLLQITAVYPAELVSYDNLQSLSFESPALLVVDLGNMTRNSLSRLKSLSNTPILEKLCVLDTKSRHQVFQARELGIYNLVHKDDFSSLLVKLRELLGNYAKPNLGTECSGQIGSAVNTACSALDQMSQAILNDAPLPVPKLARSAVDITNTICTEGLDNWLSAVQQHHSHTYCHTMMVTGHAVSFAKALGLPEQKQYMLGLGGLVHDLGKVRIPLSILDKPAKLNAEERDLVNKHPRFSQEILCGRKEVPKDVVDMAVWHHEMLDGSGYPDGLSGESIPDSVRMVTIVDIYSALTEKRAYKDSYSPRQAFSIMSEMGNKLDQQLLRTFRKSILSTDLGALRRTAAC
ncbi:HD domain-containing phosphohydrolase [uncultured Roseibium sp.]|uniref:HD-GYP domain-containing protein n=1 Tax=uncultured Roseibium sp. TaxID=1936171 RepID=UPI002604BE14|nr:HD domain-containing phosphohydrolase [uncultured Roseibium sp.]